MPQQVTPGKPEEVEHNRLVEALRYCANTFACEKARAALEGVPAAGRCTCSAVPTEPPDPECPIHRWLSPTPPPDGQLLKAAKDVFTMLDNRRHDVQGWHPYCISKLNALQDAIAAAEAAGPSPVVKELLDFIEKVHATDNAAIEELRGLGLDPKADIDRRYIDEAAALLAKHRPADKPEEE